MYEVFLNDRRIILADALEPAYLNGGLRSTRMEDQEKLSAAISQFLANEEDTLILTGQIEWLWPAFQTFFKLIPAAGGVVRSEKGYLFIYRKHHWDLPKGKIDSHESAEESALREVREETGLVTLSVTGILPSTWHIYRAFYEKSKSEWILKETKWFTMLADGDEPLIPETAEDIEIARWFPKAELWEILSSTYSSLKQIIRILL